MRITGEGKQLAPRLQLPRRLHSLFQQQWSWGRRRWNSDRRPIYLGITDDSSPRESHRIGQTRTLICVQKAKHTKHDKAGAWLVHCLLIRPRHYPHAGRPAQNRRVCPVQPPAHGSPKPYIAQFSAPGDLRHHLLAPPRLPEQRSGLPPSARRAPYVTPPEPRLAAAIPHPAVRPAQGCHLPIHLRVSGSFAPLYRGP